MEEVPVSTNRNDWPKYLFYSVCVIAAVALVVTGHGEVLLGIAGFVFLLFMVGAL